MKVEKNKTRKIRKQNICSVLFSAHCHLFFILCSLLIVLCSCQTISNIKDPLNDEVNFFPLDKGASVYFFADVQEARPILEILPINELNNNQTKQMLDRTAYIAGAFFPENNGRRFQLIAWGKYINNPGILFSSNKSWVKMRSFTGNYYWHSAADRLSIAMNAKQAFIAQSKIINALGDMPTDPFAIKPGIEIPDGFNNFRNNRNQQSNNEFAKASLSLWIGNPSSIIDQMLSGLARVPVQQLFINIFPLNKNQYEAEIRLRLENNSQARAMSAILNIAGGFTSSVSDKFISSLFLANPPVQNENNLDIKSAILSESDIAGILSRFF